MRFLEQGRHVALRKPRATDRDAYLALERANASVGLVWRAGLAKGGHSPRFLKIAGRWSDHERWALLSEDWKKKPTASSST